MATIGRVRTEWTGLVQGGGLSTHYFLMPAYSNASAQAVIAQVNDFWQSCRPRIASGTTYRIPTQVDILEDSTGDLVSTVYAAVGYTNSGSAQGTPLPPANQGLVRWTTGAFAGGRRIIGRTFIPSIVDSSPLGPGSDSQLQFNEAINKMLEPIAETGVRPVVWSRKNGASYEITDGNVWGKWAILRSRRD